MKDIQQNLDRFQKRAKTWVRQISKDPETFSASAEKTITKLSKLLTEEVKPYETIRPLHDGVVIDISSVPTADILAEVTCKAANPKLKNKLLRK